MAVEIIFPSLDMASRDRRQSGPSLTVIMLANERRLLAHRVEATRCLATRGDVSIDGTTYCLRVVLMSVCCVGRTSMASVHIPDRTPAASTTSRYRSQ